MSRFTNQDWIHHSTPLAGIERIEAFFCGNAYGLHRHDTYALGVTLHGVQSFNYRRSLQNSLPGDIMVLHPDEPHDGQAGTDEGFGYRMVYLEPALLQQALGGNALPFIEGGISRHPHLKLAVAALVHDTSLGCNDLASHEALANLASALESAAGTKPRRCTASFSAAQSARDYIHESLGVGVTMAQLELACARDRWSLSRDFKQFFGTSPYRYQTLRRLDVVKRSMQLGHSLADCAFAAGFSDQSHMTRQFAKAFGLSPARWLKTTTTHAPTRTIVQDA
jgi:AraC-like DNA-binding protein